MNRMCLAVATTIVLIGMSTARAEFIGNLEFVPPGCEQAGLCAIKNDFLYKDPTGVEWLTKTGDKTDGASIPPWAQPFVGQPFDKMFIKAAVIHDHYCDRHVRPWRQTHRVFYDALVETGLAIAKAKLMYYAVYLFGPKWVEVIPGKPCGGSTTNCVFEVHIDKGGEGTNAGKILVARQSQYGDPELPGELQEVDKLISDQGDKVDLAYLEQRAQRKRPNDYFYALGSIANIKGLAVE